MPTNTQLVGGNNAINIDECLQILEHSIEDIQPRRPMSQVCTRYNRNTGRLLDELPSKIVAAADDADTFLYSFFISCICLLYWHSSDS